MDLYTEKEKSYFTNIRYDIKKLIPENKSNKILEIGCGNGSTLLELKNSNKARYIVGIDIVNLNQEEQLDKFICCNIEEQVNNLPFSKDFFDVIICADVLEHLVDPWKVLQELKMYLNPDGLLIASIPNIRELKTMVTIFLKGDFRYEDTGILDKTHLRFFCKKNVITLFECVGFDIKKIYGNMGRKRKLLHKLSFGVLEEFLVTQYLIVAQKATKSIR